MRNCTNRCYILINDDKELFNRYLNSIFNVKNYSKGCLIKRDGLNKIVKKNREIIKCRFFEKMTRAAIGNKFNLSRQRISQIEYQFYSRFKRLLNKDGLNIDDYLGMK